MSSSIKFSLATSSKHTSTSAPSAGFKLPNASKPPATKQKSKSVLNQFNDEDDDEQESEQNKLQSLSQASQKNKSSKMIPIVPISSSKLSRQQRLAQEEATKLDSTIFEYDQVYDLMKLADSKAKSEKDQKGAERKPQYISGLIETAKQRKIDRVRAEDKLVQRERELEGQEFANKDEFVTPAYLQQQKELREAEEAEKLKAEKAPNKQAMTTFYQNILEEDSKRHEAAVKAVAAAAATTKKASSSISLGLSAALSNAKNSTENPGQSSQPQYDPEPEAVPSEAKLAVEIGKKLGRKVDIDDEGRIVDHRQLLTGGLNLGPPKLVGPQQPKKIGFALPIAERKAQEERERLENEASGKTKEEDDEEEGLTQAEKLKLSRERQSNLLQQQLIELENKKRKLEEESRTENMKKVAKRNDDSKIEMLKQQALKRRQERQAALKESEAQAPSS
ncbi:hypothetical protein PtA15_17A251 [Puccinia triticina]|uniref:Nuclear speckle splicing regulatory protein 1 N-terminal domain-containing protein n=1 Tax=Puccinia triticina TaxID=208348 RepID=A0ABY7D7N3_9BASI|nr:uncharacterized protein PtA15_17A251 [Puccinia triticina]WAQ92769.1 hypothetical protein PtA15_17A251 [Puccinia triticina]WAR63666.1 hypothetical protein PtB15_17B267 [Puccinia triticina]